MNNLLFFRSWKYCSLALESLDKVGLVIEMKLLLTVCYNTFLSFLTQKHDPPTSSIPCLHYKKMKEQEERELNGDVTHNAEESPVKPTEEANGDERAGKSDATAEEHEDVPPSILTDGGPDGEDTTDISLQGKESQPCDTAQGALGQVKAKAEVCKDESIGKGLS